MVSFSLFWRAPLTSTDVFEQFFWEGGRHLALAAGGGGRQPGRAIGGKRRHIYRIRRSFVLCLVHLFQAVLVYVAIGYP